ncbi:S8 family peptidase [Chitinophaga sp. Cy-1792]|uniref:S8 family peptidase n=1 Tax=Chitinophaga sp. Cy-1792 TaxID=2608339 RepID=UPI001421A6E2|nr:S8 family peptidase [Chitinophaga sp. Cy-1792]NIG57658.1 S8 family serine peptidase [Chitinophaga sp. Cy-1792]
MNKHYFISFTLLLLLLCCCKYAAAQQGTSFPDSIYLRYGFKYDMLSSRLNLPPYYLIKFKQTPGEKTLQQLHVVKVLTPLHYIILRIPEDSLPAKKRDYYLPASYNWKASTLLLQQLEKLNKEDSITTQVNFKDSLQSIPGRILYLRNDYHTALLKIAVKDWDKFIALKNIIFADAPRKALTEMIVNTANPYVNGINLAQQQFPGIDGKSIAVSVKEDRFDTTDIDLAGRYIYTAGTSQFVTTHASTMATIIGGAGNTGALGLGAAPAAGMASANFNISLLPDTITYYTQHNITIQNHSYGTDIENYYGTEAVAYDQQIYQTDTIMHVFSAGNIGTQAPTSGIYQNLPWANLSGNFKQGKNVIVVGGTDASGQYIGLASHGPAYDGRIKPEIAAFGQDGTSGAAAATSGIVTLLQDAWRQQYNTSISATLARAILINSARLPFGIRPNYNLGFGNVHAAHALQTLQQQRYRQGNISSNGASGFDLTIPPNTLTVKVTLCWNDPPAPANATKALINDLDLQVTGTDQQLYLPWTLSTTPNKDSLNATARRSRDSINNNEQVTIDFPAAGTMHVNINAHKLATASQSYAIAYEFIPKNSFTWQNPVAGTTLTADTSAVLYWETTYGGTGDLAYSLDSGSTWHNITTGYPLYATNISWQTPNVFSKAILRYQLPDTAFISAPFIISPQITINTGFNCPDSVFLYWNSISGAGSYQVYAMGTTKLTAYSQVRDTFIFISKRQVSSTNFAVAPISAAGWEGRKSYTADYTMQGVGCYVKGLLADKVSDNSVQLTLLLGSNYLLKTISWQRYNGKSWETIGQSDINSGLVYYFNDPNTWEGLLYYRVQLTTTDGRVITSDVSSVQISTSGSILLFPNPVSNTLGIMDPKIRERQLVITDMSGRVKLQARLFDSMEGISVSNLPAGVYICTIYYNGQRIFTKKFVKQ